ncbi:MAG: 3-oxoacyl-[acyl-carrier-protein] synthase 2 [Alphaproteobacteria bacterium MarineAlpha8_Bin1]|nr:MAG: 3-oxoacyl-[acyl-carrier-protein] synthase 2 [Alphaproteobacteria bacterium MarineAlpha8_Bin1]|tara:strand:- start:1654 stop:2907 length:1254 start_codon:yes stop_codon:yes gene_type:complete
MRRVVVTGMGMCTPLGYGVQHGWSQIKESASGIRKLDGFDIEGLTSKIGGQIPETGDTDLFPEKVIEVKDKKKMEPFIQYALIASKEALKDSGWQPQNDLESQRTGVMVGSGIGGLDGIRKSAENLEKSPRKISPFFIPSCLINLASGHISIKYNLKGPNHSVVTACSSGAHAIGDSYRMIAFGDADVMVAGGTESACTRFGIAGFCAMRALSTNFNDNPEKASRPWDKDRDGFVLSEGAGILILEDYDHAKKRSANIYGEIIGYGLTGDAYHPTAPSEDGNGGYRAMKMALNNAKIDSSAVDYINAHGTSTPLGDEIEFNAVKKLFESDLGKIHMSSTKSSTGHLLGASGAIEAIFSILSIKENILPPTLNLDNISDGCNEINLIPHTCIEKENLISLSNSFGFGGTNVSLIFKKI